MIGLRAIRVLWQWNKTVKKWACQPITISGTHNQIGEIMKIKFGAILALVLALFTTTTTHAQLKTESVGSSAKPGHGLNATSVQAAEVGVGGRDYKLFLTTTVVTNQATLDAFYKDGVGAILATGKLPASYPVVNGVYPGMFSDGWGVIVFVDERAGMGGTADSVALADDMVVVTSSDGNTLGETNSFVGKTYGPGAIVVRDGEATTAGSSTIRGSRIIYGVGLKRYNATSAQVTAWFDSNPGWNFKVEVRSGQTLAFSQTLTRISPKLLIAKQADGNFRVTAESNGDPYEYKLMVAMNLGGKWTQVSTLHAGAGMSFAPAAGQNSFFFKLE